MRKHTCLLFVLLAACLLSMPVPSTAGNPWVDNTCLITYATDNQTSNALALPKAVTRIAIGIPTITSATINLKVSYTGASDSYQDLYCMDNNAAGIAASTGGRQKFTVVAGTGGINVEVPCNMGYWRYIKVYSSAEQTNASATRRFTIYGQ